MKAARLVGPRRFEISDIETPVPQPGEVLVRMEHVSICGSDLLTYDRVFPEEEYPLPFGRPCHECAGTIAESRDDTLKVGQRVVALTYAGGLVEYAAVAANRIVPVPDNVDPTLWVLCQPLGTVIYGVKKLGSVVGQRIVVLGQGPIGLTFTDLLARQGPSQLIVTDVVDHRLEVAGRLGATHTINAAREDVVASVIEATHGAMADIVIDCCGLPETSNQVFDLIRSRGTAVIFGMPHGEATFMFNWGAMYNKLPTMLVLNSQRAGEVVPAVFIAVDLVSRGVIDMSYMVSHHVPLADVGRAYELFSTRTDGCLKVLIDV